MIIWGPWSTDHRLYIYRLVRVSERKKNKQTLILSKWYGPRHSYLQAGDVGHRTSTKLTLVLLSPDMPCLYKQCRSRSVGHAGWSGLYFTSVCNHFILNARPIAFSRKIPIWTANARINLRIQEVWSGPLLDSPQIDQLQRSVREW